MSDPAADVQLKMQGILIGISLAIPAAEFTEEERGHSFSSLDACKLMDHMEGEPAMVGRGPPCTDMYQIVSTWSWQSVL